MATIAFLMMDVEVINNTTSELVFSLIGGLLSTIFVRGMHGRNYVEGHWDAMRYDGASYQINLARRVKYERPQYVIISYL